MYHNVYSPPYLALPFRRFCPRGLMSGRTSVWVHEFLSARLMSRVFLSHGLPCWIWLLLVKCYKHTHGDPSEKLDSTRSHFQGQPRLLNGHESIVYIWLSIITFDSKHVSILYPFPRYNEIMAENCEFFQPMFIWYLHWGVLFGIV